MNATSRPEQVIKTEPCQTDMTDPNLGKTNIKKRSLASEQELPANKKQCEKIATNDDVPVHDALQSQDTSKKESEKNESGSGQSVMKELALSNIDAKDLVLNNPTLHPVIKTLSYIPYELVTTEILDQCCTFTKFHDIKGKCLMSFISFDTSTFNKLTNSNVKLSLGDKRFLIRTPFLKSSFGYSPYTHSAEENKISNVLRLSLGDAVDTSEMKVFDQFLEMLDDWIKEQMFKNRETWPVGYKYNPKISEEVQKASIGAIFGNKAKKDGKDGNPEYIVAKYDTQRANNDVTPSIPEDPTTAHVNVWSTEKVLIATKLTSRNAFSQVKAGDTSTVPQCEEPILHPKQYVQSVLHISALTKSGNTMGVRLVVKDLLLGEYKTTVSTTAETCPF